MKNRSYSVFARVTVLALGGCNAILGIDEHELAGGSAGEAGSAGEVSAGGSATGGRASGSGGRGGSASPGPDGEGGGSAEAGGVGASGHDQGGSGEGGSSDVGGGAGGEPPAASGEGGSTGAMGGTAGATGGTAEGGSSTGGTPAECSPEEKRCSEGELQSCENARWGSTVECKGYCSEGKCIVPPSCDGSGRGVLLCGTDNELCCKSSYVPGTTGDEKFYRSYDGVTYTDKSAPAAVSGFLLDKYEVTVGRFRRFLAAAEELQWVPPQGAGKHEHLPGGALHDTLNGSSGPEQGWQTAWNQYLRPSAVVGVDPDEGKQDVCPDGNATWTASPELNEDRPIVCANWFEAYAFCIWDGGFLPTETEWNYAAAGGALQRVYPWSDPPGSDEIECAHAHFGQSSGVCDADDRPAAVGSYSAGKSRWGHFDLAGNVWEWTLDRGDEYVWSCVDCAAIGTNADAQRVLRGGSFYNAASDQLTAHRNPWPADPEFSRLPSSHDDYELQHLRSFDSGFRCARSPLP